MEPEGIFQKALKIARIELSVKTSLKPLELSSGNASTKVCKLFNYMFEYDIITKYYETGEAIC